MGMFSNIIDSIKDTVNSIIDYSLNILGKANTAIKTGGPITGGGGPITGGGGPITGGGGPITGGGGYGYEDYDDGIIDDYMDWIREARY